METLALGLRPRLPAQLLRQLPDPHEAGESEQSTVLHGTIRQQIELSEIGQFVRSVVHAEDAEHTNGAAGAGQTDSVSQLPVVPRTMGQEAELDAGRRLLCKWRIEPILFILSSLLNRSVRYLRGFAREALAHCLPLRVGR